MTDVFNIINQIINEKINLLKVIENEKTQLTIESEIKRLNFCLETLSNFYNDNLIKIKAFKKSIDQLNKQNEKFELICLLYGIDDFKSYQLFNKNYLINLVKDYRENNQVKIPFALPINKKTPYRSFICKETGKYILKKK